MQYIIWDEDAQTLITQAQFEERNLNNSVEDAAGSAA